MKGSYFKFASFAAAGDSGGGRSSDFDFAEIAEVTLPLLSPVVAVAGISSPPLKSPSSRDARPDRVRRNIRIVSAGKKFNSVYKLQFVFSLLFYHCIVYTYHRKIVSNQFDLSLSVFVKQHPNTIIMIKHCKWRQAKVGVTKHIRNKHRLLLRIASVIISTNLQ